MCHIFSSFLRHLICATSSNFTLSRRYFCDPNPFAEIREIIHAVSALASLWRDSSVNPITLSSQNPSFLSDPFLHPHFVLRFPLLLLFLSLCLYSISYINILVHPFTLVFFFILLYSFYPLLFHSSSHRLTHFNFALAKMNILILESFVLCLCKAFGEFSTKDHGLWNQTFPHL